MALVGCDGILVDDGRVLLQQREDFHTWGPPGGGLEPGEYLLDGARREVLEESGLDLRVERLTGVYAKPHKDELVFYFDGAIIGGRLGFTDEADQARYFSLNALPDTLLARQRERILDAAPGAGAGRNWPIIKQQGAGWAPAIVGESRS